MRVLMRGRQEEAEKTRPAANMQTDRIVEALKEVAGRYPPEMREQQMADISRIAFNISVSIRDGKELRDCAICDIGGGIGLFSAGCAAVGFGRVILVDDFRDEINRKTGDSIFEIHKHYGVRVISRDVMK